MKSEKKSQSSILAFDGRYKSARITLLVFILFSLLNIFLSLNDGTYMLFSSYLSMTLVYAGALLLGETGLRFYLIAGIVFAVISLIPYVLCAIFSKKHYGWMIAALCLVSIDTIFLLVDTIPAIIETQYFSSIIDIGVHIAIIIDCATAVKSGISSCKKPFMTIDDVSTGKSSDESIGNDLEFSRTLNFTREKSFVLSAVSYAVFLNNTIMVGKVKNGETLTFNVPEKAFSIIVMVNGNYTLPLSIDEGYDGEVINANIVTKFGPNFTLSRI